MQQPPVAPKAFADSPYPPMPVLPEDKDSFSYKDIQPGVTTVDEVTQRFGIQAKLIAEEPWTSDLTVYSEAKLTIADRQVRRMYVKFLDGVVMHASLNISNADKEHVFAAMREKWGEPEWTDPVRTEWKNAVSGIRTLTTDTDTSIDYWHTKRSREWMLRNDEPRQKAAEEGAKDL